MRDRAALRRVQAAWVVRPAPPGSWPCKSTRRRGPVKAAATAGSATPQGRGLDGESPGARVTTGLARAATTYEGNLAQRGGAEGGTNAAIFFLTTL